MAVRIFSAILIITGFVVGLFLAAAWNFCWKDCEPVGLFTESSYLWAPFASLLFTLPAARYLLKNASEKE